MSNGTDPAPAVPQPSAQPPPPPPLYPPAPKPYLLGIEPQMAKMILAAGIVLYLLVTFVENGAEKKLAVKRAEFETARLQLDAPVRPTEPDPPSENDYKDQADALTAAKKDYDEQKKKYDDKMKEWKKDNVDWLKDGFDRKKEMESLQRDSAKLQAAQGNWGYFKFFLKFLASLAIVLALVHFLFHGTDWERAVSLFLLGTMAVRLLS